MEYVVRFIWAVCVLLIILITLPLALACELKAFIDEIYDDDMYYGGD